jgi:hypothetical protein
MQRQRRRVCPSAILLSLWRSTMSLFVCRRCSGNPGERTFVPGTAQFANAKASRTQRLLLDPQAALTLAGANHLPLNRKARNIVMVMVVMMVRMSSLGQLSTGKRTTAVQRHAATSALGRKLPSETSEWESLK